MFRNSSGFLFKLLSQFENYPAFIIGKLGMSQSLLNQALMVVPLGLQVPHP